MAIAMNVPHTVKQTFRHLLPVAVLAVLIVGIWGAARSGILSAEDSLTEKFRQADKNGDGRVTAGELGRRGLFRRLDLDEDGFVTLEETYSVLGSGKPPEDPSTRAASAPDPETTAAIRQGPKPQKPGDRGVGRFVGEISFRDVTGREWNDASFDGSSFTVFAGTSTSCPLSKKYVPSLVALANEFGPQRVTFILVNPVASDVTDDMQETQQRLGSGNAYVFDKDERLTRRLGLTTTTDVVVIDAASTVVYHGAIDDQYGFGYSLAAPRHRYLAEALGSLLAGQPPHVAATDAPGCELGIHTPTASAGDLTYHNRISRIVEQHCVECHRDGGVAPFALDSYDDVVAHAPMIEEVIERGIMPPWFAAPPADDDTPTPWSNDRSLATAEKQDLLTWIAGGQPEGDAAHAAEPRTFPGGWLIGQPDAVYEFNEPVPVQATGVMPYQNIVVETHLPEDRWVRAIEVVPGSREVVHHVLVFAEETGGIAERLTRRVASEERGGFFAAYVPGNSTLVYPEGFAKKLPKGTRLRFQMHYTPNGTATTDSTKVGVIFADEPPQHEVHVAGISNLRISIPPGAPRHPETATIDIPTDVAIMSFMPHMHLRGAACRYDHIAADGTTSTLLDIPRYDFNWQLLYRYFEPKVLHAGDTIRFTGIYDNSAGNPANPDPAKTVRWGPQTEDEMLIGYVEYYVLDESAGQWAALRSKPFARRQSNVPPGGPALFKFIDQDGDKSLSKNEVLALQQRAPQFEGKAGVLEAVFRRLDANEDGGIDRDEFEQLKNR